MRIEPHRPTVKTAPEYFAGDVWLEPVAAPHDADQRSVVALVRFSPGARTAWHRHARGQYLHVTQGVALFGTRDGTVIKVHAGQTAYAAPGEEHWHAALPDAFMEHFAVTENGDDPANTTTWLEHVTDEQYQAAQLAAS